MSVPDPLYDQSEASPQSAASVRLLPPKTCVAFTASCSLVTTEHGSPASSATPRTGSAATTTTRVALTSCLLRPKMSRGLILRRRDLSPAFVPPISVILAVQPRAVHQWPDGLPGRSARGVDRDLRVGGGRTARRSVPVAGPDLQEEWRERPGSLVGADAEVFVMSPTRVLAISPDASRPWWEGVRGAWRAMHLKGITPRPPAVPTSWSLSMALRAQPAALTTDSIILLNDDGSVSADDRHGRGSR